jgi:GTP-binding protein
VIVNAIPGTTRDAVDTLVEHAGTPVMMIDTAGIRRRGRLQAGIERYAVLRALRAIDRADVALIVIDAAEGPTDQDTHVAGYVEKAGKGIAVVVNKWDLIGKKGPAMMSYSRQVREAFKFVAYAPILFVSAKTRYGVDQILDTVLRIAEQRERRIGTSVLNDTIAQALADNPLTSRGKQLKVYYATQPSSCPPTFVLFVNDPKMIHFSYERYLQNRLREAFGFEGTPIQLIFRKRGES